MGIPAARDLRLARAMLNGNKERAERWVTEQYPAVYRLLQALTNDRDAAADLTQQTFLEAWRSLESYRGEARLQTWLMRIAYRQYSRWLDERRRLKECPFVEPLPARADAGLVTVQVERALNALSQELREAFVLHYVREMSIREIAHLLEVPAGTVKSRLFAARRALRQMLKESDAQALDESDASQDIRMEVRPWRAGD